MATRKTPPAAEIQRAEQPLQASNQRIQFCLGVGAILVTLAAGWVEVIGSGAFWTWLGTRVIQPLLPLTENTTPGVLLAIFFAVFSIYSAARQFPSLRTSLQRYASLVAGGAFGALTGFAVAAILLKMAPFIVMVGGGRRISR